ncbi:MAG TPA: MIP/aquaporin family protein [Bacteroidales bacterium]|nr:MIP/aquaporin family protein [Bacteroidales bacterium]
MSPFLAELTGTALILIFGGGVVANVVLNKTKGNNSGWIVITFGWAIGVYTGVLVSAEYSGAHLNPAITLALAVVGKFPFAKVAGYVVAQLIGAMLGAFLVWIAYRKHFEATSDPGSMQAIFCTAPNIRSYIDNLLTEIIGTFVLTLAVLYMAAPEVGLGALNALPVALVVLGLGLSLGGPTGYAINPARDLGPRIIHALLPIKPKAGFDLNYAWVPIAGPVIGGLLAALFCLVVN